MTKFLTITWRGHRRIVVDVACTHDEHFGPCYEETEADVCAECDEDWPCSWIEAYTDGMAASGLHGKIA